MNSDDGSNACDADVVLVGGGLANCLIALRLAEKRPETRILLIDSGAICGNHTWSFHTTDLKPEDHAFLRPVIDVEWPGQQVCFPAYHRRLDTPYASISSQSMRKAIGHCKAVETFEHIAAHTIAADHVVLSDQRKLRAPCVIDGRGYKPDPALAVGFQKFHGLELETKTPHGQTTPIIMDARVEQLDGYRFIYVLPLSKTRLLIEDTRYSDGDELRAEDFRDAILSYASHRGWKLAEQIRQESGVLPIALAYDVDAFWRGQTDGPALVGMRAGLFQPTTGYSLPEAVRVADLVASQSGPLHTAKIAAAVQAYARKRARDQSFMRFLNRMLFLGAQPEQRLGVLERFYRLPQGLIERFYAGDLTLTDKLRIVSGKPPIPIHRGLACVSEAKAFNRR